MKAIIFTAKHGSLERERFEKALSATTLVIKNLYVTQCCWFGDDLIFEGETVDYQRLYFWVCGYGDALAVIENEARRAPQRGLGHELADAVRAGMAKKA